MTTLYRVRVALSGDAVAGGGLSTYYFRTVDGTAQQAATAVATLWVALEPQLNGALTWTSNSQVDTIETTTGKVTASTAVTNATGVGDSASERLPEATQLLVRLRTGVYQNGREVRGRLFIPGMTEANSSNGTPLGAMVTSINSAFATLVGTANANWVVYSPRYLNAFDVSSANCWGDEFAVLRSRRT